jgi:hypothetical protein
MPVFECPFCKSQMPGASERPAETFSCPTCAASVPAGAPPDPASLTLGAVRNARRDDDDDDDDDGPAKKKGSNGTNAVAAGAGAAAGIGIGMILLIVGGVVACCICLPGVVIGIGVMAVRSGVDAAFNAVTINNAREIAQSCHTYQDMHKALPSPKMKPQQPGMPAPELSWRVSILANLNMQQGLFQRFDKNQAWDNPGNKNLLRPMPVQYRVTTDLDGNSTRTKFQYFTGPNTLFPEPLHQVKLHEIPDGTSNTFLFAEAKNGVDWTKPEDMTIAPGAALPLPETRFIAAMADAHVRIVNRKSASDDVLRQAIDPKDGKALPNGWGE